MEYDRNDLLAVCLCSWREARGEPTNDSMEAVMHVIRNQVGQPGFGNTVHQCVFSKNAFSSMTIISDLAFKSFPMSADGKYTYCLSIVGDVLGGLRRDMTLGAKYYANRVTATSGWFVDHIAGPNWTGMPGHNFTAQIGHHSFFL